MKHIRDTARLAFNSNASSIMHIDLNSAFATIEQQANPHFRGKPLIVAAYETPGGFILAPSVEAKKIGIKMGMRVIDAKKICPGVVVKFPDPNKYRAVHVALRTVIADYTPDFYPKSIDEFVLNLDGCPILKSKSMHAVGLEIKNRIKADVGDHLTVSVGIGPNRFLAKIASNLKKPDGLEEINHENFLAVYTGLTLTDLHGINIRNEKRLNSVGIFDVLDFYDSSLPRLKLAFRSILGYYWHLRLRGWEIDEVEFGRRSFGNSHAIPRSKGTKEEITPILQKLCEKTGSRLRKSKYKARGVHLGLLFKDGTFWHKGQKLESVIFDSRDIYKQMLRLLNFCSELKPIHTLSESVFALVDEKSLQLNVFEDMVKKQLLVNAIDDINDVWGDFTIAPARIPLSTSKVLDRIAFGGVKELEEFTLG
jgi:DNA polymerase IV